MIEDGGGLRSPPCVVRHYWDDVFHLCQAQHESDKSKAARLAAAPAHARYICASRQVGGTQQSAAWNKFDHFVEKLRTQG